VDTQILRNTGEKVTPESARAERGLRLFEEHGGDIERLEGDTFLVPSCSGSSFYRVRYGGLEESCECKDWEFGGGRRPCKHLIATALLFAARRSGIRVRTISVAGDPFKAAARAKRSKASTAECAGCGQRFHRGELVEVQDSLTYFEGDLLCRGCWQASDAVVL
jgi:hypothetical protein